MQKNGINAIPIHQYPIFPKPAKRGRPPTIDFVFRKGYQESPYLGFECKIVDDEKASSIREYVDQGMKRFLSGKYAKAEKLGGMIAYLINRQVAKCVQRINDRIKGEMEEQDCLFQLSLKPDFDGVYQSKHKRPPLFDSFLIYHVFMTFSA